MQTLIVAALLTAGRPVTIDSVTDADRQVVFELAGKEGLFPPTLVPEQRKEAFKRLSLAMRRRDQRIWPISVLKEILSGPIPLHPDQIRMEKERERAIQENERRRQDQDEKHSKGRIEESFDPFTQRSVLWLIGPVGRSREPVTAKPPGVVVGEQDVRQVSSLHNLLGFGRYRDGDREGLLRCEVRANRVSPFVERSLGEGTPVALVVGDEVLPLGLATVDLNGSRGSLPYHRAVIVLPSDRWHRVVDAIERHDSVSLRFGELEVPITDPIRRQAIGAFGDQTDKIPVKEQGPAPPPRAPLRPPSVSA